MRTRLAVARRSWGIQLGPKRHKRVRTTSFYRESSAESVHTFRKLNCSRTTTYKQYVGIN
jgi:hypothetical protein